MSDRTRVLFGICAECNAIIESHVSPSDEQMIALKAAMKAKTLLPADRTVLAVDQFGTPGPCPHHAQV